VAAKKPPLFSLSEASYGNLIYFSGGVRPTMAEKPARIGRNSNRTNRTEKGLTYGFEILCSVCVEP
jgi:hypothetical protein